MAALNKDTITGFHFAKGGESPWAFKISIFIRALQDVCGMIRASLWLPWFRYVLLPLGETLVVSAKEFIGVYRLLFREVLLVKALHISKGELKKRLKQQPANHQLQTS